MTSFHVEEHPAYWCPSLPEFHVGYYSVVHSFGMIRLTVPEEGWHYTELIKLGFRFNPRYDYWVAIGTMENYLIARTVAKLLWFGIPKEPLPIRYIYADLRPGGMLWKKIRENRIGELI